jgi:4-hydroxymandelate synthase
MEPQEVEGVVRCQVRAFGDVVHTIYQTDGAHPLDLTEGVTLTASTNEPPGDLGHVDHIAVCLASGDLTPVVEQYTNALGFAVIFEERVQVGDQAMNSKVVQGGNGRLTLTLLEPDEDALPGQIDDFLKDHGDVGVQHVALETADIVAAVRRLKGVGVPFLTPLPAYYESVELSRTGSVSGRREGA